MKKISINSFLEEYGSPPDFFICSASYEDRCKTIPLLWKNKKPSKTILFYTNTSRKAVVNRKEIESFFPGTHEIEQLFSHEPLITVDKIAKVLSGIIKQKTGRLLLDVTTFTHEQVLILVNFINYLKERNETFVSVEIVYTSAKSYGGNTKNMWLSDGVLEVRPVVGYSGNFIIGKPIQLIILVGFEHDRAKAVIEHIEPSALCLGVGDKEQSISSELANTNHMFFQKLQEFVKSVGTTYSEMKTFSFSCVDPLDTEKKILEIATFDSHNVIVCPMNTKISTLGVALAGISRREMQVIYAEPQEYNVKGYSTPGEHVRYGKIWEK